MATSPYRWISRLGAGSSGEVWAAVRGGREIAVKVLKSRPGSAHAEALRREMRLGPILAGHPNIIAVERVEDVEGAMHLEMEWVRGPSLADVLRHRSDKGQPPLPPSVVVPWAVTVLEALDWAGSRVAPSSPSSFVHRDIKPANLLLDTDGRLRITDFGIARAEAELGFQTTHTGIVKGSPRYMAPEIIAENKVDARADQFSLGAVLYQLLSGEPLYRGKDLATTLIEAMEAEVEPRIDLWDGPLRLKKVLRTMLAKDPRHRYTNHRVAADALRALRLEGPSVQSLLHGLLQAVRAPDLDPEGPSMSQLPDLGDLALAEASTATTEVMPVDETMDLPSLELDPDIPPVSALLADRDKGDTVPLRRAQRQGGDPHTELSVTQQAYDRALARELLEGDDAGVTAPIPIQPEDEEPTVVKSADEIARELGLLEGHSLDEHTVASEEVPDPRSTDTDVAKDERTVVLPELNVPPPPPPRVPQAPPVASGDNDALPLWAYFAVGCSVMGLAVAMMVAGVAVGLFFAARA